ncbi:MAG: TOBE domain-containing protein [Pseudomonadota bacterium]
MAGKVTDGAVDVPAMGTSVPAALSQAYKGHDVTVGLRPEHLEIDPSGDALTVDMVESLGGVSYAYLVSREGERIIVEQRGDEAVAEGVSVGLSVDPSRLYLFDAKTEQRIRA